MERNAVDVPTDGKTIDIAVLVSTGANGVGSTFDGSGAHLIPIWRIDDGPVYGIPWETCMRAQEQSDMMVSMGAPPSWPGLTCANTSYTGPDRLYSQAVTVTEGAHTLHAGTLVMVRTPGGRLPW